MGQASAALNMRTVMRLSITNSTEPCCPRPQLYSLQPVRASLRIIGMDSFETAHILRHGPIKCPKGGALVRGARFVLFAYHLPAQKLL